MKQKTSSMMQSSKITFAVNEDCAVIVNGIRDICVLEKEIPDSVVSITKDTMLAIKKKQIRVIKINNEVIGFLQYKFTKNCPYGFDYGSYKTKYCWIDWMYVVKKYRGYGIGNMLHKDIITICKQNHIKEIMLDVFHINKNARKFYEKENFCEHIHILKQTI